VSEKRFLELEHVVPVGKVQVLGAGSICGVDTEKFRPNALLRLQIRAELGIPEDAVVCLFLGRLAVDKGVLDLAKAFVLSGTSRPDLWLMFVGPDEDDMVVRLRELVPEPLSDRLRILGFTNHPEKELAVADFLCLPSYREGFGMAILEAAAAGIPAIGTRIYGITDAIEDSHTGRLVSVGDIEELSRLMTLWRDSPAERGQYAIAARSRVISYFEQQKVVERYVRYFRDIFSYK
jgi:glycosyltransferase involved in cell wall biosynthesis